MANLAAEILEMGFDTKEIMGLPQQWTNKHDKPDSNWPEPEPLAESELAKVMTLSKDIIPAGFREWLDDIASRLQCPFDFVAAGAIVVISSVIGAGCCIRPKRQDDWSVVPNLWGGVVGRPSIVMKSPSLAEVMKPLIRLEIAAKESFEEQKAYHDAVGETIKARRDAIKAEMLKTARAKTGNDTMEALQLEMASLKGEPEITRKRYKVNDATIEKMQELMNENPRGLLYFRDELVGLLNSWDREDRQQDRSFFLECWDGKQPFTSDRIGRGTTDAANVCVSILGGIQPAKLTAYLMQAAGELSNDGMIQRFQLLVFPDEPSGKWKMVDRKPNTAARERAFAIFEKLANTDFASLGATVDEEGRPYFRFDDDAQQIYNEWATELENEKIRGEENPLLCEHFGKYRSLMPSLALIFHLIHIADGAASGPVTALSAAMACEWVDYLETHARRVYGLIQDMGPKSAATLASKIKSGKLCNRFEARDVYRNHWNLLDKPSLVAAACDELASLGWLRREYAEETGGRPGVKFLINPKIFL